MVVRYAPDREAQERILENRIYQQISGALAGSQEFMAMEKLYEIHERGSYDLLVLDRRRRVTPSTSSTRPSASSSSSRGARCGS